MSLFKACVGCNRLECVCEYPDRPIPTNDNEMDARNMTWEQWHKENPSLADRLRELEAELKQVKQTAWHEGATWMLESILASLREYPNGGGDIEVMREVERIVAERTAALEFIG